MKFNIKDLMGDRILIKQERTKTVGKIIIAEDNQEKNKVASVLQVGTEVENVHIGDKVLFDKFSETVLEEEDGAVYSIITEEDVIAIVGD